jgi:hypothetical protein
LNEKLKKQDCPRNQASERVARYIASGGFVPCRPTFSARQCLPTFEKDGFAKVLLLRRTKAGSSHPGSLLSILFGPYGGSPEKEEKPAGDWPVEGSGREGN